MTTPAQAAPTPPASRREILGFTLAFLAAIAVILALGGSPLWTRQFWLDERCCTLYNSIDASNPIRVILNVAGGRDVAPPLLHLIVWTVTRVIGTSTAAMRCIPLAAMGMALLLVYLTMRRRFGILASGAAAVAITTHVLIVEHSFELRFYGLWVMFCAGFAWALELDAGRPSRRRDVAIALFAIAICTIHWFGVISLGAMIAIVVLAHGRRWREGLRLVAPGAAGIVLFVLLSPMFVSQVRAAGTSAYWIPPLSMEQVKQTAWLFVGSLPPLLNFARTPLPIGVVGIVLLLLADRLRPAPRVHIGVLRDPSLIALTALILMPVALIAISMVSKPVVWPRYAIVAVLSWAPILALAIDTLPRLARGAVLALFVVIAGFTVERELRSKAYFKEVIDAYQSQLEVAKKSGFPIIFQSYFLMYPVDGQSRRESVARFLDLPDSTMNAMEFLPPAQKSLMIRDRNMVRIHKDMFGFPVPITQATLDTVKRFYLFTTDDGLPAGYQNSVFFGEKIFPHHQGVRVSGLVTLFQRKDLVSKTVRNP